LVLGYNELGRKRIRLGKAIKFLFAAALKEEGNNSIEK
jgi:hypothetical protein